MNVFDLLVLLLATSHAIEVYHHGSIFADIRARVEASDGFFADLLSCMFCLSLWVGAVLTTYYLCLDSTITRLPVYALAVTRGANLLNDLTHHFCRTPGKSVPFTDE